MHDALWLQRCSPAFRLTIATSWLAPEAWREKQKQDIRAAIDSGLDWEEYLRLVDRHRTPPLSWAALRRVPRLEIPELVQQELHKRSKVCQMQAIRHAMLLTEALKAFNRVGIKAMPLKGPLLSLQLYGDLGIRQSHDLDLACSPEDIPQARVCLEALGWRLEESAASLTSRQWQSLLRFEHHLMFAHSHKDAFLELHWRDLCETTEQASLRWARSSTSVWQGCVYQVMQPADLVLYLCNHGGRHAWFRAKWLGDLARLRTGEEIDWALCLEHARKLGHERVLLPSLLLLKEVYGLPVPELAKAEWKSLPPFLIERTLHVLKAPEIDGALARFMDHSWVHRYDRLVLPRQSWREFFAKLLYARPDYQVLRLPDRFFWAYAPLRPVLWVWRHLRAESHSQEEAKPLGVDL